MIKYNFTLSVWNERYINLFLKACLPILCNQIKDTFKKNELGNFFIYSDKEGLELVSQSQIYKDLSKIINIKLHTFDFLKKKIFYMTSLKYQQVVI